MRKRTPTHVQVWAGHAIVGAAGAYAAHQLFKGNVGATVGGLVICMIAHAEFDAPVSQVIASLAA